MHVDHTPPTAPDDARPPPGPPASAPPPGPPSAAAPPKKSGGGTVWLILFIVAAVLFVGALVFAIISFTGKSSAEDDKDKAQKELASTKKELEDTQGELGTQRGAGQVLGRLVNTGESAADNLKACTDAGFDLRQQIIGVLNDRQAGNDVNPRIDGLNAAINQNDAQCNNASSSYQDFKNAVNDIRNR